MTLYHGSSEIIIAIDFEKSNLRTDFGKGFYMGSRLVEARKWATGKSGFSGIPTVMRYSVKDNLLHDTIANALIFDSPNKEWLDFVKENRRRISTGSNTHEPRHSYGAVSGPIADDKANTIVAKYCNGVINAKEALVLIRTIPNVFQISFHTPLALTYISITEYQQYIVDGKWSGWREVCPPN